MSTYNACLGQNTQIRLSCALRRLGNAVQVAHSVHIRRLMHSISTSCNTARHCFGRSMSTGASRGLRDMRLGGRHEGPVTSFFALRNPMLFGFIEAIFSIVRQCTAKAICPGGIPVFTKLLMRHCKKVQMRMSCRSQIQPASRILNRPSRWPSSRKLASDSYRTSSL